MTAQIVLDSSAVLALALGEPGSGAVEDVLPDAIVSAVNHTEIVTRLIDRGWSGIEIEAFLFGFPYDIRPFDVALARVAAQLRRSTRSAGLSLGDRACLALARDEGLPVLTADRAWLGLQVGVAIRPLR